MYQKENFTQAVTCIKYLTLPVYLSERDSYFSAFDEERVPIYGCSAI